MPLRTVCLVLGVLFLCLAASFCLPVGVSLWYGDGAAGSLVICMAGMGLAGLALALPNRACRASTLSPRQGFAIVGLCWLAACLAGMAPYVLGGWLTPADALFESTSGFTTTGATILSDIEALPRGILMWRSLTHWIGGLGIIALALIVLPLLGVGNMSLYRAEASGPRPGKLTPRMRDTSMALWKIYVALTVVLIALLMGTGMDWFDAVNHAFSTVATGGFSTRNASIAAYPDAATQWILMVFMFISAVRFSLHYAFVRGQRGAYGNSTEFVAYGGLLILATAVVAVSLARRGLFPLDSLADVERLLRASAFQVVSISTTTGFVTENYGLWPSLALLVVLLLSLVGGCTGSTSGGLKVLRAVVLVRAAYNELFRVLHPKAIRSIQLGSGPVPPTMLSSILNFFVLFVLITLATAVVLTAQNMDLATALSASLACVANVGPGLGAVGPVDNFGWMPGMSKVALSLAMLLGRLEFYALLIMFAPEFWKK